MDSSHEYLKACQNRHYQSFSISRAIELRNELIGQNGKPTAKSKLFVQRINNAKGYEFIRN